MSLLMFTLPGLFVVGIIVLVYIATLLRKVVAPNEVHIVQSTKRTTSYGKDTNNGNVYYAWPAWLPIIGVTVTTLPVSVFNIALKDYEAYDKDRVPFVVDIYAFFRIDNTNLAAQRVQNFNELEEQLTKIVQGAIRTVLASNNIDDIMIKRSEFGEHFTVEVKEQLTNWGVVPVKNMELMDIRDTPETKSIHNIMAKKQSLIEMQSRSEVAKNLKDANIAEINASQETETQKQGALQLIGKRTAQKEQEVGIANQQAAQAVKEQERITKEKEMAVLSVAQVKQAEITKNVNIVQADQEKQVAITVAEGALQSKTLESQGVEIAGKAKAAAETAILLAPVTAQTELADKIGANEGYQKYLITIRQVEANQIVGVEQAKALEKADVKIIANSGDPVSGISNVRDLLSAKGGQAIGAALEGLANTDQGKAVLAALKGGKGNVAGTAAGQ